jgi:uncharacterized SAM-binding protein YcdF (DUF218 family)
MTAPDADKGLLARRWFTAAFCLGLGLLTGGVAGFLRFSNAIALEEAPLTRSGVAALALTGGAERITDAIALVERGHAGRLLITGVNASLTHADVARLAPRSAKIVECCVDLGYEARNTLGNAREARQWLAAHDLKGPVIVVTSNYHMPRALIELGHELPDTELIPFPVVTGRLRHGAWWNDLAVARLWAGEYVKYLAAAVRIAWRSRAAEPALSSQGR